MSLFLYINEKIINTYMKFNFAKIIDFLQPTYAQLKGLLVASIGIIGTVYFVGIKTANFQHTANETNRITKENSEMIKTIVTDIERNKVEHKNDMVKLYNDLLDMNTRNNILWDSKFNALLQYGSENKNVVRDIIRMLDEQQKLYEEDRKKNMEYWSTTRPVQIEVSKKDSLNIMVRPSEIKK